ncbi:MAG: SDR family NAD(P)-dependent oxidoreductase [Desulfomonilia bacterium]|nr:SDR family NAD(P)-dependent oxidoreductase [Deltaproteobacteria bacterium]MDX9760993.1 SDR family NAD(P)-dependent oxidoreductase [Desulfomonilia bacterium]HPW68263.1 SDR family NAD(P)-dependent oxidoreductase [Deltaproteobacteria bacterium]
MKYDLRDKAVVLTGGSRGIGRAVAWELAKEGARIGIAARDGEKLADTARAVSEHGSSCVLLPCDVAHDGQVRSMVDRAAEALGGIDVFMNIAGVTLEKPLEEATPDDYRRVMETNLLGTVRCTCAALPHLKQSRGLLVNIASIIVRTPFPYLGVYACSKWAVAAFSATLRQELYGTGVRVLTVFPTVVSTDMKDLEPVLANSPAQSPQQCARAIVQAIRRGKVETDTAILPKFLSAAYCLAPGLGDMITRLFLPREYRIRKGGAYG